MNLRPITLHQADDDGPVTLTATPFTETLDLEIDAARVGLLFALDLGHAEALRDLLDRWIERRRAEARREAR